MTDAVLDRRRVGAATFDPVDDPNRRAEPLPTRESLVRRRTTAGQTAHPEPEPGLPRNRCVGRDELRIVGQLASETERAAGCRIVRAERELDGTATVISQIGAR